MSVLINRELLLRLLQQGEPAAQAVNRAVGKTTGAILAALGESYSRPGGWVNVDDPDQDTMAMRDHLAWSARQIIYALNLRAIEVRVSPNSTPRVQIRNTFAERLA